MQDLLEDTCRHQGWQIPRAVQTHMTQVLAHYIDQPNWRPEPSYAERYLQIRTISEALTLGNVCWFTRAVFPELGSSRGINSSYYVQLGQGCYQRVLEEANNQALDLVCKHFEFTAEVAYTAIRHWGQFREMWD